MTEILITNYARRKSGWSAFGHGFDTRRLHHETLDNTEMCCRGLFILESKIVNRITSKCELYQNWIYK